MKIITDRYCIQDQLGQGGSSITYAAIDKETNEKVAIKALSLTGLDNWKKIELFKREAKILQQLNHPAIPKYLDCFQIETENDVDFYIVQQLAPGQSLAHLISEGWQPTEDTVKNIAIQILEILVYLQQLTPPVIHRDIKPQNIIYQPDTAKLFLVDFGAVQDVYHHTVMGSTVVGTYGYMAPEQYRGGTVLSTDLYALGCTLLFLLTKESPAELPQKKLKIDFRNAVNIKRYFVDWIDKLIEPNLSKRFPQAEAALLVLQDKKSIQDFHDHAIVKPRFSSIKIRKTEEKLIIDISAPYQIKSIYFLLLWTGLSILNGWELSVFLPLLGDIYRFIWLYRILPTCYKQTHRFVNLLPFISIIVIGYTQSIPIFFLCLVAIDAILEFRCTYNFIKRLIFTTQVIVHKNEHFTIAQKVLKFCWRRKTFKYRQHLPETFLLPEKFLTKPEKQWLQAEIVQYLQRYKKQES